MTISLKTTKAAGKEISVAAAGFSCFRTGEYFFTEKQKTALQAFLASVWVWLCFMAHSSDWLKLFFIFF